MNMYSSDLFLYSLQVETEIFSTNIDSSYFSSSTGIKRRMATQQRLRLYTNTCSVFFLQVHFLLSTERSHQWDQVSLRKYAPRDTNLVIKKKKKQNHLLSGLLWRTRWPYVLLFYIIWLGNQIFSVLVPWLAVLPSNSSKSSAWQLQQNRQNSEAVSVKCGKSGWPTITSLTLNLRNAYLSLDLYYLFYPEMCCSTM